MDCSVCKTTKDLTCFPTDNKNKNRQYKHYWCTQCLLQKQKEQAYNSSKSKIITRLISTSKRLATERGGERSCFDIDRQYILELLNEQDNKCAISGMELEWVYHSPKKISIDRIDNAKGYIRGNVRLVCKQVNFGISNFDIDHFYTMCKAVVIYNKLQD